MKKRPWFVLVALLGVGIVTWLIFAPNSDRGSSSSGAARPAKPQSAAPSKAGSSSDEAPLASLEREPEATVAPMKPAIVITGNPPQYTPEQRGETVHVEARQEIERVQEMLRDYRTVFGENPVGTNAEIVAALNGGNSKQARLGPPEGQGLNEKGELVDRWGTPYFFHQLDGQNMEIHSAGADRKMGTPDDVVMR
ncbi:hypothetical protein AYO49_00955 [Verrucomicrobiaceae bacterium SCGC AG-212-N21]|nr:hypothetical protein AYO49_00955 [Verrucomicrobiaceae bacterium SCGC AG-212-N21]